MPEHFRALFVILFLTTLVFAFVEQPYCQIRPRAEYKRRRNSWYAITLIAFLAHNFWLFSIASGLFIYFYNKYEANPAALFLFLLFTIPSGGLEIPGFGLVNFLFSLSYPRLLAIVILFPAFLKLTSKKSTHPFGRLMADKLLSAYLLIVIILFLRETTVTDTLRQTFYQFTDIFLPYYVISRSINSKESIKDILLCFGVAILILAPIALFESLRHWHLYDSLSSLFDIRGKNQGYATRIGFLRAHATTKSIPLGYLMAAGIGFYLYLQSLLTSKFKRRIGLIFLIAGLVAAMSRAPWMGSIFLVFIFILTGNRKTTSTIKIAIGMIVVLPLLSMVLDLQKFYDILPYVGKEEQQLNVEYRERLLENSLIVIKRHPWFGSVNYLETPEMESLRQGQGIIDVVNSYIRVALETGIVGLSIFVGFFLTASWGVLRSMVKIRYIDLELHLLGRCLLATMAAILFIIFTVSSISIIPIVYWSTAAICVGYSNLIKQIIVNESKHESQSILSKISKVNSGVKAI